MNRSCQKTTTRAQSIDKKYKYNYNEIVKKYICMIWIFHMAKLFNSQIFMGIHKKSRRYLYEKIRCCFCFAWHAFVYAFALRSFGSNDFG